MLRLMVLAGVGLVATESGPPVAPPPRLAKSELRYSVGSLDAVVTAIDPASITVRALGFSAGNENFSKSDKTGAYRLMRGNPLRVWVDGAAIPCTQAEWTRETLTLFPIGGGVRVIHRSQRPEQRFPAGPLLRAAAFGPPDGPHHTYRLADVRVGDEVSLSCELVEGEDVCQQVFIQRRPGGRVPPAPWPTPTYGFPYDEAMNAFQDYEEWGVPLPDKYDPDVRSRELAAQVQAIRAARAERERTAPYPRVAKPKP